MSLDSFIEFSRVRYRPDKRPGDSWVRPTPNLVNPTFRFDYARNLHDAEELTIP
jgi:hypothetical protein